MRRAETIPTDRSARKSVHGVRRTTKSSPLYHVADGFLLSHCPRPQLLLTRRLRARAARPYGASPLSPARRASSAAAASRPRPGRVSDTSRNGPTNATSASRALPTRRARVDRSAARPDGVARGAPPRVAARRERLARTLRGPPSVALRCRANGGARAPRSLAHLARCGGVLDVCARALRHRFRATATARARSLRRFGARQNARVRSPTASRSPRRFVALRRFGELNPASIRK